MMKRIRVAPQCCDKNRSRGRYFKNLPEEHTVAESKIPAVGDSAPPIAAPVTGGGEFDLSTELGKWVVVYFYPRANTPG
jgi:alkyl hydroperoxide reductase subunit AhpC